MVAGSLLAVMVGVMGVMGVVGVPGVGGGAAHAQPCDPVEVAKLLASDGAVGDNFGSSVSIDGGTAVFGAHEDGFSFGAVYVFTRNGDLWTEQAKLVPAEGESFDVFGWSASISGDTIVIGAPFDDDHGSLSGSAYIFTRSGSEWTQQAKLLPIDGAAGDGFGHAVSVSGDTVVIGARRDDDNGTSSGSAYVFTRSGGVWTQQAKLLPDDGAAVDQFGQAVSIVGDTVVIGAPGDTDNNIFTGSAYVFARIGSMWTQQAKLLPSDGGTTRTQFGAAVSLSSERAVIGAPLDGDNGIRAGAAYVFKHSEGVWTQQAKLLPADGATWDYFGYAVSLSGNTAIIGAYRDDDNGVESGSAYVFTRRGGAWTEQAKLLPADNGTKDDHFGRSVSISGDKAVIGAWGDDDNGPGAGAAHVFDLNCNACPADFNNDGVVNTQDFLAFLGAWSIGDPLADWNEDGEINTLDFLAYLSDWVAGC